MEFNKKSEPHCAACITVWIWLGLYQETLPELDLSLHDGTIKE